MSNGERERQREVGRHRDHGWINKCNSLTPECIKNKFYSLEKKLQKHIKL